MTLRLNNPKSPRVTTPAAAHQANSRPYRTLRNVASAAINPVSRTRSPSARRAAATPTARPALPRAEPPAAFRVIASRAQLRHPGAAAIGDLHPDSAGAGRYRDRDRLPGKTRAAVPDAVAEKLAREQDSIIPAGMPRAEYRAHERADNPRPFPSPGDLHALPNRCPSHQRTCLPVRTETPQERADAWKCTLTSAADVKPNMRPRRADRRKSTRCGPREDMPPKRLGQPGREAYSAAKQHAGRFIPSAGEIFSHSIPFHNGNNIDCDIKYRIAQ